MESLPIELLLSIGQNIQESCGSQKTLRALTLCCRKFHNVFQPLMYSYISSDTFSVAFVRLIIRLWRERELASQVRRLDLCWWDCDQNEHFDGFGEDDEAFGFIQDALNEIFTPEEEEIRDLWEEHLTGDRLCAEAWLGLMLVRMTHLEIIEFGHESSVLMSDILRKAAKRDQPFHQGSPFPHLQEVRGCVQWGASWISSPFFMPFFYFPAVRKIYGSAIGEFEEEDSMSLDICQSVCPVKEIVVDEGYWCRGMLGWLSVCTELERISIRVETQADEHELIDDDKFDASQYRLALLPFTATLNSLRISYGDSYKDRLERAGDDDDAAFGSFKDFADLQHIAIRHAHLCKKNTLVEIFPCSLKSLEITDLMSDDLPDLLSELSNFCGYRDVFVEFERLVLHLPKEDEHAVSDLQFQCEALGVYLKLVIQEDW